MRTGADFPDLVETFSTKFRDVYHITDGGYDRGYQAALDDRTDLVATENGEYFPEGKSTGFRKVVVDVEPEDRLNQLIKGKITELIPEDFKGVTNIPDYAFEGDVNYAYREFPKIKKATVHEDVTSVGQGAFMDNRTLTHITFKTTGEVAIGSYAFERNTSLTTVDIAGSATVGNYGFAECPLLLNIDTSKIVTFREYCFTKCTSLKSVFINTSNTVERYSFSSCTALEDIAFGDMTITLSMGVFSGCTSLKTVVLPSNVNHTGYSVFSGCKSLETVEFYNRFNNNAFQNCAALKYVRVRATTPPSISTSTFNGCTALEKIAVPIGSGDAYRQATNWSAYADIIVEEEM